METEIRNVGSYMVIERIEGNSSFGEDVYYGVVKYRSPQSKVEPIYKNGVTYLKKDIEGNIIIDGKEYDLLLYYKIILNFIYPDDRLKKTKNKDPFEAYIGKFEGLKTI